MEEKILQNISENKLAISKLREETSRLEKELKYILINKNGLNINDVFIARNGDKVYICSIDFESYFTGYNLRYKTKKIKKDGTFGLSWDNSYGYRLKDLLELERVL